jgi:hypothetical protein
LKAGEVVVPINALSKTQEIAHQLRDSGAKASPPVYETVQRNETTRSIGVPIWGVDVKLVAEDGTTVEGA